MALGGDDRDGERRQDPLVLPPDEPVVGEEPGDLFLLGTDLLVRDPQLLVRGLEVLEQDRRLEAGVLAGPRRGDPLAQLLELRRPAGAPRGSDVALVHCTHERLPPHEYDPRRRGHKMAEIEELRGHADSRSP